MVEINLHSILSMLAESMGIEGAEKLLHEAIKEAGLTRRAFYTEDEFSSICDRLKTRGGLIKIFATLVLTSEYREAQYQKIIDKERRTKTDLTHMNIEMEMLNNELRLTNEKLKVANDKLKKMQEEILKAEKLAAIGVLASGVGHELRNPLGSIKNICFYLKRSLNTDDPKIASFIELLYKEVNTANKIVTDLLDYSRTKKLTKIPFSIDEILSDALSSSEHNNVVNVVKNLSPDITQVDIDPDKMKQVFVNLITNAYQSMLKGGTLTITVKAETDCSPIAAPDKQFTAIEFTDTGSGMDQDTLRRVFDPLFTTKLKGIGLGLSIAKEIVEQHNGAIYAKSEPHKGSTFTVLLPVERKKHGK